MEINIIERGMKITKIEYEAYFKINQTKLCKLDLSYCKNSILIIYNPVNISENIDKLNSSNRYYNYICYTSTSDYGTDIILDDRKKEFIDKNKAVCQEECVFSEYDYDTKRAKCSCKVKEISSLSSLYMNINKTKLYENFKLIKYI